MFALATTIVIPVLDGEGNVPGLVDALDGLVRGHRADGAGPALEAILVDDGSADRSWPLIVAAARERTWLRGIELAGNHGQHAALLQGALEARTDAVVTIDDDLAHAPEDALRLVAALARGADLAYGTPVHRGPPGLRRAGSWAARCALALGARRRSALGSSPFRAFRRALLTAAPSAPRGDANLDAILYAARPRVATVRVEFARTPRDRSRYGVRSLARALAAVARGGRSSRGARPVTVRSRAGGALTPDDAARA